MVRTLINRLISDIIQSGGMLEALSRSSRTYQKNTRGESVSLCFDLLFSHQRTDTPRKRSIWTEK